MADDSKLIWEAYFDRDPKDFRLTEDDYTTAEQELRGVRLSDFIKKHDADKPQPVALHTVHIQKHYGKIHTHHKGAVTGDSIADAVRSLGNGELARVLQGEARGKGGYIVTKIETGDSAEQEISKKKNLSASMDRHYDDLNRGKTNYRGD